MNKKFLIIALLIVILLCICGAVGAAAFIYITSVPVYTDSTANTYDDYTYVGDGYRLQIPSGWESREVENVLGAKFFFPTDGSENSDNFNENLNVIVQNTGGMNLTEYSELSIQQFESGLFILDSRIISQKTTEIDGYPAYRVVYTNEGSDRAESELNFLAYWTVVDDKAYVITFTGDLGDFDKYVNDIEQKFVPSFRVR